MDINKLFTLEQKENIVKVFNILDESSQYIKNHSYKHYLVSTDNNSNIENTDNPRYYIELHKINASLNYLYTLLSDKLDHPCSPILRGTVPYSELTGFISRIKRLISIANTVLTIDPSTSELIENSHEVYYFIQTLDHNKNIIKNLENIA